MMNTKILLVDDHADTGIALKLLLERKGFEVTTAQTMTAALAIGGDLDFAVLVSDIGLPDGDGLELLARLTAQKGPIRALAVSGFCSEADVARSLAAGFHRHISKPFHFPDLEQAIRALLVPDTDIAATLHSA